MAYELNWDTYEPITEGAAPLEGVTTADGKTMISDQAIAGTPEWISDADAGYSDTFNALKSEMDFVYSRYKDQLSSIPTRKGFLKKELQKKIFMLILFALIIPIGMYVLVEAFEYAGANVEVFSVFYLPLKILSYPVIVISIFFGVPPAARDLVNVIVRWKVLMNSGKYDVYREKRDIVSFDEEEHFLKYTIGNYDRFYERVKTEGLDQVGGGEEMISLDELTPKQKETLSEMKSMTIFKEVMAHPGQNRKEAGWQWLLVGLCIMFGGMILLLSPAWYWLLIGAAILAGVVFVLIIR